MDKKQKDVDISPEAHAKRLAEGYRKQNRYNFFGFAIFDFIHIIVGIALYVILMLHKRHHLLELAECIVEVIISVILIGFVDVLAEGKDSEEAPRRYFSFAWIVASSSLLIPSLFNISILTEVEGLGLSEGMSLANIVIEVVMFASFFASLLIKKTSALYKICLYTGMLLFAISGAIELIVLFVEHPVENAWDIVEIILETAKNIAPFILSGLGIYGMVRADISDNGRIL